MADPTVEKLGALALLLGAPLWPKREDLSPSGKVLFAAMVGDGKEFCLAVAAGRFSDALGVLSRWSAAVDGFLDETRISGDEAAGRLLAVFLYFCHQVALFGKIEGRVRR